MKLIFTCFSCEKENKVKSLATTRPDLVKDQGSEDTKSCNNCGTMQKVHVNRIIAIPSKLLLIFGGVLGLLGTIVLWSFYGAIGTVTFAIPFYIYSQERKNCSIFNKYRVNQKH